MLCLNNLSDHPQAATLRMPGQAGATARDVFGGAAFGEVDADGRAQRDAGLPRVLLAEAHRRARGARVSADVRTSTASDEAIAGLLRDWAPAQRWFAHKGVAAHVQRIERAPLDEGGVPSSSP